MNGFFVVVTAGFAAITLYALGLAIDYRGWRSQETRRMFPNFNEGDVAYRVVDTFGQVVAWIVVATGTFAFVCAVVATVTTAN